MTIQQKLVIWAALAGLVMMGIYPPWIEHLDTTFLPSEESDELVRFRIGPRAGGYHWIFSPPSVPGWAWSRKGEVLRLDAAWNPRVDYGRLSLQWTMLAIVAGGLFWTIRPRPQGTESPRANIPDSSEATNPERYDSYEAEGQFEKVRRFKDRVGQAVKAGVVHPPKGSAS